MDVTVRKIISTYCERAMYVNSQSLLTPLESLNNMAAWYGSKVPSARKAVRVAPNEARRFSNSAEALLIWAPDEFWKRKIYGMSFISNINCRALRSSSTECQVQYLKVAVVFILIKSVNLNLSNRVTFLEDTVINLIRSIAIVQYSMTVADIQTLRSWSKIVRHFIGGCRRPIHCHATRGFVPFSRPNVCLFADMLDHTVQWRFGRFLFRRLTDAIVRIV